MNATHITLSRFAIGLTATVLLGACGGAATPPVPPPAPISAPTVAPTSQPAAPTEAAQSKAPAASPTANAVPANLQGADGAVPGNHPGIFYTVRPVALLDLPIYPNARTVTMPGIGPIMTMQNIKQIQYHVEPGVTFAQVQKFYDDQLLPAGWKGSKEPLSMGGMAMTSYSKGSIGFRLQFDDGSLSKLPPSIILQAQESK